jgi:hypothetical protein
MAASCQPDCCGIAARLVLTLKLKITKQNSGGMHAHAQQLKDLAWNEAVAQELIGQASGWSWTQDAPSPISIAMCHMMGHVCPCWAWSLRSFAACADFVHEQEAV